MLTVPVNNGQGQPNREMAKAVSLNSLIVP
jgi:hypothetical protein